MADRESAQYSRKYDDIATLAHKGFGEDKQGYRREFVRLVEEMKQMEK